MKIPFVTDADVEVPPSVRNRRCGCEAPGTARCTLHGRRRVFTGLLAAGAGLATVPGWAQEAGVRGDVGSTSRFAKLVPADQVEAAASQEYNKMLGQARAKRALAPPEHPQVVRLRAIADRLVPLTPPWNGRAKQWRWEVNLIGSSELNAFCMPGGKIAFYYGILEKLQLDDDEVSQIMGHEMAHALREHARERMGKTFATQLGVGALTSLLGLGSTGETLANIGGQLLTLRFSREDESEADLIGMELAARAGYNPSAGISLWEKMGRASKGAPPQWLSTHPSGSSRINDLRATLPKVEPLYAAAPKPTQRFAPPAPGSARGG